MKKPRGTRKSEFEEVLKLINQVFRVNRGYEPTMEKEFPLLLAEGNIENMRIIEDGGKPVSCVNFVKRNIMINGAEISAASIGAVCTDEEYRGNGYSSLILDDVEDKLYEDGVDLALVSGTRALYQRRGYTLTKNFIKYKVYPDEKALSFKVEEFKENDLLEIARVYNMSSTRYVRTMEDFKKLIKSGLFPWGNISYKSYVIKEKNLTVGYVFIKIQGYTDKEIGIVVEAGGKSCYIKEALKHIGYINDLDFIEYNIHINDRINFIKDAEEKGLDYQAGSVKIINFESFMEKLRPYFLQLMESEFINEIQFNTIKGKIEKIDENTADKEVLTSTHYEGDNFNSEDKLSKGLNGFKFNVTEEILDYIEVVDLKEKYRLIFQGEVLEIEDIRTLNKLVFEGSGNLDLNYNGSKKLKDFVETVFPIPFVYTANLNYQ